MSRPGSRPPSRDSSASRRSEVVRGRPRRGDDERHHPLGRDDVGHQGLTPRRSPGSPRAASARRRHPEPRVRHARSRTRWRSSASRARSSRVASSFAASVRSSARSATTSSSCGTRTGWTRLASIRARSDHSNSTSGDRDRLATRSPRTASRRPCPVTIVCRSRLPNELCHSCRSASPRRRWPAPPLDGRSAPPGPRARRDPQSYGERRPAGDPHRPEPAACLVEIATAQQHQRRVQPDVDRPPAQLERVQLGRRGRPRAAPGTDVSGPSRTSAPCTSASALSRKAGVRARSKRARAARAASSARSGPAPTRRGRRWLGLTPALPDSFSRSQAISRSRHGGSTISATRTSSTWRPRVPRSSTWDSVLADPPTESGRRAPSATRTGPRC